MVRTVDPHRPEFEREILRKAGQLFSHHGYLATTIEEIADQAGLQKSSLYHYFKSKENILFLALSTALQRDLDEMAQIAYRESSTLDKLRVAVASQIRAMVAAPYTGTLFHTDRQFLLAEHRATCIALRDRHEAIFKQLIDQGIAEGAISPCDTSVAVKLIYGAINWTITWWKPTGRMSEDEICRYAAHLLVDRLLGEPAHPAATAAGRRAAP
jgi:AcrR family transcriptional regulator